MLKVLVFYFHFVRSLLVNILVQNTPRNKIKDSLTICMERAVEKHIKLSLQLPRKPRNRQSVNSFLRHPVGNAASCHESRFQICLGDQVVGRFHSGGCTFIWRKFRLQKDTYCHSLVDASHIKESYLIPIPKSNMNTPGTLNNVAQKRKASFFLSTRKRQNT